MEPGRTRFLLNRDSRNPKFIADHRNLMGCRPGGDAFNIFQNAGVSPLLSLIVVNSAVYQISIDISIIVQEDVSIPILVARVSKP